MDVPPNDLDRAQWRAKAIQGMESPRIVALIAAWCLIGGAAAAVVGWMVPPLILAAPLALVGAWVLSLVALGQTRSWLARFGPSFSSDIAGRSTSRLLGDVVMTLVSATALAPMATASQVVSSYPEIDSAERRSLASGVRARRVGAWVTFVMGALFIGALVWSVAWVYQQSQRDVTGTDAWYIFAPIVVGFLGGWLLMVVNGVTALVCLGIGGPTRSELR